MTRTPNGRRDARTQLATALVALLVLAMTACSPPGSDDNGSEGAAPDAGSDARTPHDVSLAIASAQQGGAYYVQGAALAEMLVNEDVVTGATSQETGGAVENARLIANKTVSFAFLAANWVLDATEGNPPFEQPIEMVNVLPVQNASAAALFFVVRADSDIESYADLEGKRVVTGAAGSGMEGHALAIFEALGEPAGITQVQLGFADGSTALAEGRVDAVLQCCIPSGSFTELQQSTEVRVLPYTDTEIQDLLQAVPHYREAVVPAAEVDSLDADVATIGTWTSLVTTPDADEELVYDIVTAYVENIEKLLPASPQYQGMVDEFESGELTQDELEVGGVPLHPGALRALKDAGVIS